MEVVFDGKDNRKELVLNAKENRKELVKALVLLTQQPPVYVGPPTYAYEVGNYTVNRNGNIVIPGDTDESVVQNLIDELGNMGFTCVMTTQHEDLTTANDQQPAKEDDISETADTVEENAETEETETSEPEEPESEESESEESETEVKEPEPEPAKLTLSFPVTFFAQDAIDRIKAIVASKATLLKKALDTDNLAISIEGDKVCFPWFTNHGIEGEVDAYSKLAYAIAKMAITQNRVLATEKQNADEKLAMRLFLIRLGFIGDEYKTARAILMRNFTSSESRKKANVAINLCMPEVSTDKGE